MRYCFVWMLMLTGALAAEPGLTELIEELGADAYRARESAQVALAAQGATNTEAVLEAAIPFLKQADLDVEIRVRLKDVVRTTLMDQVYNCPLGYVGLYMGEEEVLWDKKVIAAILVTQVVEGGPCDTAGLVVGDHIIGIQGVLFGPNTTTDTFINGIQGRRPGMVVTLKVKRAERVFDAKVTLGVCPPNLARTRPSGTFDDFFEDWWAKHIGR